MFTKYLNVSQDNSYAFCEMLQSHGLSNSFHKTATDLPASIIEAMEKIKPENGSIFVAIAPMGMGEYWGSNVNGDFFPEKGLRHEGRDYGHKTFEYFANMFRHHINKDPKKGFGKIIKSDIDDKMKRVVVISKLSIGDMKNKGAGEFLKMLEDGTLPEVSMGCKVPYDVCSICGNKAKSPLFYCKHLQPDGMLKVDSQTGKIAYAINDYPKFFDLSFVHRGADRSSGTLMKIASDSTNPTNFFMPSGLQAILLEGEAEKKAEEEVSRVEESFVGFLKCASEEMGHELHEHLRHDPEFILHDEVIDEASLTKMAQSSWGDICGTMWSYGIPMRREEVQFVSLVKMGHSQLAKDLHRAHQLLPVVKGGKPWAEQDLGFSQEIEKIAQAYAPGKSVCQPHLLLRTQDRKPTKVAAEISDFDAAAISAGVTATYSLLAKLVKQTDVPMLAQLIKSNPALLTALGLGSFAAAKLVPSLKPPVIDRKRFDYDRLKYASVAKHISTFKKTMKGDLKKNLQEAVKSISTELFGDKADLAATGVMTAGFLGYLQDAQNEKEKSKKYPWMGDVKGFDRLIANHPFLSTAAFMTAANLAARKGLGFLRSGKKAASDDSVKINMISLFPEEEMGNSDYLNSYTLDLLK